MISVIRLNTLSYQNMKRITLIVFQSFFLINELYGMIEVNILRQKLKDYIYSDIIGI